MNLQCRIEIASLYKAQSQIARVVTEDWCARELYCAACDSNRLSPSKNNTQAVDFICPNCEQLFQLKSVRKWGQRRIVDAGYESMIRAIRTDRTPNLLVLQYSKDWAIENLMLIPRVFFSESAIEKRPPLSPAARRAGWVGCNIILSRIADDGRITIVSNGSSVHESKVRAEFSRVRKLADVPPALRGWTLDVLNSARKVGSAKFSLAQLYKYEDELKRLHPSNQNIRPKIRQQLQVLRDLGLVEFITPGEYALKS